MARIIQGVFSWEDVLAQRYLSEFYLLQYGIKGDINISHIKATNQPP